MVTITLYETAKETSLLDSVGEGKGELIWENGIETCIISYVKRITSPGVFEFYGYSDFGAQEKRSVTVPLFPFCLPGSDGTRCCDLRFLMLSCKATFSLSSSILIKRLFSLSLLSAT